MSNTDNISISDLLKQREELEKKIEAKRKEGRDEALKRVREECKLYEFSVTDLRGCLIARKRRSSKSRDKETKDNANKESEASS